MRCESCRSENRLSPYVRTVGKWGERPERPELSELSAVFGAGIGGCDNWYALSERGLVSTKTIGVSRLRISIYIDIQLVT